MGIRRAVHVHWNRLHRLPGSPQSIAAGFAWGFGISFTPMVGIHFIMSALICWLTRSNIVAAAIGTLVINPWTGPPIWYATYYLGCLFQGTAPSAHAADFVAMFVGFAEALWRLDGEIFMEKVYPLFWPMLIGSIPVGIIGGIGVYLVLKPVLTRFRTARHHRIRGAKKHAGH